jgi:hypothetical protein
MLAKFTSQTKILLARYVPTRQINHSHIFAIPQHKPTGCDITWKTYNKLFLILSNVYTCEHLLFDICGKIRKRARVKSNEIIQRFFLLWSLIIHSEKTIRYLSLLNPEYLCLIWSSHSNYKTSRPSRQYQQSPEYLYFLKAHHTIA